MYLKRIFAIKMLFIMKYVSNAISNSQINFKVMWRNRLQSVK